MILPSQNRFGAVREGTRWGDSRTQNRFVLRFRLTLYYYIINKIDCRYLDQSQSSEMTHAERRFPKNYAWRASFRTTAIGQRILENTCASGPLLRTACPSS